MAEIIFVGDVLMYHLVAYNRFFMKDETNKKQQLEKKELIDKKQLLNELKAKVEIIRGHISAEQLKVRTLAEKPLSEIKSLNPEDQVVYMNLRAQSGQRLQELADLLGAPFFVRCDLTYKRTGKNRVRYFAKYHFTEDDIYSWVTPAATIRFEKPGHIQYKLPNGVIEQALMTRKEQYMIVDGKIIFFSVETIDMPRELIHQEHFSTRKGGFLLPEIVAVMEKAQDMVIRAHHVGPFVISGPAGSGKTTLALHRVAYLVQAPDTAVLYPRRSVMVFVQDNGTKDYFSHLLPELGITDVEITTFFEWACAILDLDLSRDQYVQRRGKNEVEQDMLEFERLKKLRAKEIPSWNETKVFLKKSATFDRIDLTVALVSYFKHHKKFETKHQYMSVERNGELKERTRKTPIQYSLLVVDEFQNYMPEQLELLNACLDSETRSAVYVGDMAQQIHAGTLRSWNDIGITISGDREVRLQKVYRNTRQILEYIRKLGYSVEIPEGIKDGPEVSEITFSENEIGASQNRDETTETISYIQKLLESRDGLIGVIGKSEQDISEIKKYFENGATKNPRVHVMTMALAQGVEFDIVCIVGMKKDMFSIRHSQDFIKQAPEFIEEKKKIQKDLLYVALTRAISEMHVLGGARLSEIIQK
ncbi:MAG: hypothetical protein RIT04_270 [Candidatus Parcubacteria bacterium]|jgi:DNA helicase IV